MERQQDENVKEDEHDATPDGSREENPGPDDDGQEDETKRLKRELEEERVRSKDLQDQYLRLRAEFENFRRRTRQEVDDIKKRAAEDVVHALLPIVDNLERATEATGKNEEIPESFLQGIRMIYKQFFDELGKVGLQRIEAIGRPFDPNLHEAVLHEETEDYPDGHVTEELRLGYIFGDKVLRPSMVKVAKGS